MGEIFDPTRTLIYVNTSLTPLRKKIYVGYGYLKENSAILSRDGGLTSPEKETVFTTGGCSYGHHERSRSSESTNGTSSEKNDDAQTESTGRPGSVGGAANLTTDGTTSETNGSDESAFSISTDRVSRRQDRCMINNTKEHLKKLMSNSLNTSLDYLAVNVRAMFCLVYSISNLTMICLG